MTRTGIALGSNIGDRGNLLVEARQRILEIKGISRPLLSSRLYETDPVDSEPGSPQFLNAVIEVSSTIPPLELLLALQEIESTLGRPRIRPKNAPRTLDLDVLYADGLVSDTSILSLRDLQDAAGVAIAAQQW